MIEQAAAMIASSKRPVIYAGGGLIRGNASAELQALVDRSGIPVVTTLMARGVIADSHPLCLGMPGMHGNFTAVTSLQQADLVIALGSRFDDRVTGKVDAFAAKARIIHVDIDPAELGKVRRPDVPIVGDVKSVIPEITRHLPAEAPDLSEWIAQLRAWKEQYPYSYEPSLPGAAIKPQYVVERISALAPADTVVVSGVGQHQMWASQYFKFERPNSWINSGVLGRWALRCQLLLEQRLVVRKVRSGPLMAMGASR